MSTDPAFQAILRLGGLTPAAHLTIDGLQPGTWYRRSRSTSLSSQVGPWSAIRAFIVKPGASRSQPPRRSSALRMALSSNARRDRAPSLESVPNATGYERAIRLQRHVYDGAEHRTDEHSRPRCSLTARRRGRLAGTGDPRTHCSGARSSRHLVGCPVDDDGAAPADPDRRWAGRAIAPSDSATLATTLDMVLSCSLSLAPWVPGAVGARRTGLRPGAALRELAGAGAPAVPVGQCRRAQVAGPGDPRNGDAGRWSATHHFTIASAYGPKGSCQ